ncbi:NR1H3 isoform 33 [Pongo abelii]|uniref:NR1H3 isoform 33 n=1 Tax=Pongo abelii TaxID=9601 RepID=A0A2J8WEZ1_PONAB|nr:NR1H3 isoform 33 [Pongo abelii]
MSLWLGAPVPDIPPESSPESFLVVLASRPDHLSPGSSAWPLQAPAQSSPIWICC